MKLKEIFSCYVRKRIPMPPDFPRLRQSIVENGFSEEKVSPEKWRYKRGAQVALEFDYNSEALEIQIILRDLGDSLIVAVGNWGFPFEPLMSKGRYEATLEKVLQQISVDGALAHNPTEVATVAALSKQKTKLALWFIPAAILATLLFKFLWMG